MSDQPTYAPGLISRPEPRMSEAAFRLRNLRAHYERCMEARPFDDADAYTAGCRLREQGAYLIGYFA
jgi:hypothetical protein